ncbi:MAG: hypothetical protein CMF46_05455 [Legionellales bacterium]|nr:hypothetical protein [Legionellales bacterium]|tara:strand:+ start:157 stop:636 length:480 start_codon:yes stop_codon:yes gene_type:complete
MIETKDMPDNFDSIFHKAVERVVANKFTIKMLLHNVKWGVKGDLFHQIQVFVDQQHETLYRHTEQLMERLHIHETGALVNSERVHELSELPEYCGHKTTQQSLQSLCHAFDKLIGLCCSARLLAQVSTDAVTEELLSQQISYYNAQYVCLRGIIINNKD